MEQTLIKLENITRDFMQGVNIIHALNEVNLDIKKRSFYAIMGASGCGKTTLLNIIGLLLPATSGKLYIEGKDISELKEKEKTNTE
jgi:putative ABC transport system ATP-binding protein